MKISQDVAVTSLPPNALVSIVDPDEASATDRNKAWQPRGPAVADLDATLSSVTFSDPPTQAECEALRDAVASTNVRINELLSRLRATGGNGLLDDS